MACNVIFIVVFLVLPASTVRLSDDQDTPSEDTVTDQRIRTITEDGEEIPTISPQFRAQLMSNLPDIQGALDRVLEAARDGGNGDKTISISNMEFWTSNAEKKIALMKAYALLHRLPDGMLQGPYTDERMPPSLAQSVTKIACLRVFTQIDYSIPEEEEHEFEQIEISWGWHTGVADFAPVNVMVWTTGGTWNLDVNFKFLPREDSGSDAGYDWMSGQVADYHFRIGWTKKTFQESVKVKIEGKEKTVDFVQKKIEWNEPSETC